MILIPKYTNMFQLNGSLSLVLTDANGKVKDERYVPNTVVLSGKNFIINRMFNANPDSTANYQIMKYMEIGESETAVDENQVNLLAPFANSRVDMSTVGSGSSITRGSGTPTITYVAFYRGKDGGTPAFPNTTAELPITEAGIFNQPSGGIMLCRTEFSVVTKLEADALTISWTISIT